MASDRGGGTAKRNGLARTGTVTRRCVSTACERRSKASDGNRSTQKHAASSAFTFHNTISLGNEVSSAAI
ncbi:hypothetical protein E2C01_071308 [Portunus trituberculatus]|uniref:Uncharacterized protein n=1 Tax=Portunus trituberculatus TaxID=210409 RepID=A0A5B7I3M4_PORTR|nr:hypothetical protein [Portunus trituberculatus]